MVIYIAQEDFGGSIGTNTTTVSELSVLLVGLQENVNYTISVRAYTSKGAGPYSQPVTVLSNEDGMYFYKGYHRLCISYDIFLLTSSWQSSRKCDSKS